MGIADATLVWVLGAAACSSAVLAVAPAQAPDCGPHAEDGGCQAQDSAGLLQLPRQREESSLLPVAGTVKELVKGKGGWMDAHQHLGAGANWMGQVMCLPKAQARMQKLFQTPAWQAGLDAAKKMPGFVEHKPINEDMGVDDLYLYSIFARERIGSLALSAITTNGFSDEVERCRVDLENMTAIQLIGPGLNLSITDTGNNERATTYASGTVYPLLICLRDVQNSTDEEKPILRRRLLRTLLASSPLHDFDSGYVMRKALYTGQDKLRYRYEVQEAIDAGIVDSEIFTTNDFPKNNEDVRASYNSPTGLDSVKARFYFAILGCNFAKSGGGTQLQEWSEEAGRVVPKVYNNFSCYDGNVPTLLSNVSEPDIIGMDSLSPEKFIFTRKEGGNLAVTITSHMLKAAKKKGQRMVMHLHVGEGSPVYDFSALFNNSEKKPMKALKAVPQEMPAELANLTKELFGMRPDKFEALCSAAKEEKLLDPDFLPVHRVTELGAASCGPEFPKNSAPGKRAAAAGQTRCKPGEPAHYEAARLNLDTLLDIIEFDILPRAEFKDIHEYISFRFGHATLATPLHALRMKRLNISVDLNLGSNIMTGSIYVNIPNAEGYPFGSKPGILNTNQWADLKDFKEDAEKLVYMFRAHSIFAILLSGTNFLMGTDGTGVEQNALGGQFAAIETMLAYYNKMGPVPAAWFSGDDEPPMALIAHRWVNQLYEIFGRYEGGPCRTQGLKNQKAFADWLDEKPKPCAGAEK